MNVLEFLFLTLLSAIFFSGLGLMWSGGSRMYRSWREREIDRE